MKTDRIVKYDKMMYSKKIHVTFVRLFRSRLIARSIATFEIRVIHYRQNDRVNNNAFCKRDQFGVAARLVSAITNVLTMNNTGKKKRLVLMYIYTPLPIQIYFGT